MKPQITASILAGGKSRRMGFNKAFIKVDGQTIIERSVRLLSLAFDAVNIIADDTLLYEGLGVRVWADAIKGAGSLGGVYTALFHSPAPKVFVTACDMPFLDLEAVKKTVALSSGGDASVPFINGRFHPMHAVYSKRCMRPIEEMIKSGDLRINALLEKVDARRLVAEDYEGLPIAASVENINTKDDLLRARIET